MKRSIEEQDRAAFEQYLRDAMKLADAVGAPLTAIKLPRVWVAPSARR
jgi:hypothetical protein